MQTPCDTNRLFRSMSSTAAVTLFTAAVFLSGLGVRSAQAQSTAATPANPGIDFRAYMTAPANPADASVSDSGYSSSSSSSDVADAPASAAAVSFMGGDSSQPPPRRRYGRPNYSDGHTNKDGSSKYTFFGGGGFGLPTGGTHNYLTTGWGVQVGGGRNFNKNFSLALQFDYDHFGFQSNTLTNLLNIYTSPPIDATDQNGNLLTQLGGNTHVWSFTLNPKYTFHDGDKYGAYVVVGGGFYHKVATFTTPGIGQECSLYYGCFEYQANQTIDDYTSNAAGVNGGIGMTYKFSRFTSERFYAEARYVYVANQSRPFSLGVFGSPTSTAGPNLFPQNSQTTTYIPVKFGIRF